MKEIRDIIGAYKEVERNGKRAVLATVVHVEGSSYRRPSARMLVDETGRMTGAISGGCLEGDALRKALHALVKGENVLVTYDTSDEEDAVVGAQLGCEGIIQVLFEPIDPDKADHPVALLEGAIKKREVSILVTFFNLSEKRGLQRGTSLLVEGGKVVAGAMEDKKLLQQVLDDSEQVEQEGAPIFREYVDGTSQQNVFIEYFAPPVALVIVGAGNDIPALAQMAELLGWVVYVVDGRPTHAKQERFVSSCQVIVAKPEAVLSNVPVDDRTVFVLMTHNYTYDLGVLKNLITYEQIPYIGILGPKKKFNRMVEDLKIEGIRLTEEQQQRIYAPVGLEIGAETPEEIGLSVLSEIQSVLTGVNGTSLRDKEAPIHSKLNTQFDTVKI